MARDFRGERARADELAEERGFESAYYQREYVREARDFMERHGYDDSTFDERLQFAQVQAYVDEGGSLNDFASEWGGGNIADWFFDQYEWADWDDFRDWLEEMYREG